MYKRRLGTAVILAVGIMLSACSVGNKEDSTEGTTIYGEMIAEETAVAVEGDSSAEEGAESASEGVTEEVSATTGLSEESSEFAAETEEGDGDSAPAAGESATDDSAEVDEIEGSVIPENVSDEEFVRISDYIPGIYVELMYATENNFTGQVIYDFEDAYLRFGTVKKMLDVYEIVSADGYSIKIWDAFRPVSAQFKLWEVYPDARYVANPNTGFSSHSRGNTVDLTLVMADGTEVEMPSSFDDFSELADRNYGDCSEEAAKNADYLEDVMVQCGFKPYSGEWWHYSDLDVYAVGEFEP